uniref:Uncharacterized protein LOC105111557 isoform X2 n=1 Tax=Rhizophora mucronata TaxID=61149 RepID=A0A2P2KMX5_RHIMU
MALQNVYGLQTLSPFSPANGRKFKALPTFAGIPLKFLNSPLQFGGLSSRRAGASRTVETHKSDDGKYKRREDYSDSDEDDDDSSARKGDVNDPYLMDAEERREWRMKIREVMSKYPDVEGELDSEEKRIKMQKLLADYPLVVDEDDPDWPEDADGWGFNLGQFFNKITIKNVKKDDDDENYDSEKEIVWQDDNYIRPIKDITAAEWEETVFKDISPLIVLVHNRYKRPKENEKIREEIEKAVNIIWNCRLPSPRVSKTISFFSYSPLPQ